MFDSTIGEFFIQLIFNLWMQEAQDHIILSTPIPPTRGKGLILHIICW